MESLRFAPEDEFEGEIGKLAPAVEALDKKARLEIQEAVRRGSERLLEERRAAPADYAMGLPSVAKAFAAAKDDPALLPAAVQGRLAAQAAMGIGPEDQRALSKAEAAEMLQGYQALPEEARGEAVKALQKAYGDEIGRVAAELEEAGLPQQVVRALDPSNQAVSSGQGADEPQPPASGTEGDIINETAERLIADGNVQAVPPLPGRKPVPPPEVPGASGSGASVAGASVMPPIPERKPGSGLHPSEEKLLNKYRPLLEEEEDKAKEGLDQSRIAGLEAIIDFRSRESGASPEMTELAKRLALRNLRRGRRLESAISSALIEAGIEQANWSLDVSAYMPKLTGDVVVDAQAYMDRIFPENRVPLQGPKVAIALETLRDLGNIRAIVQEVGEEGFARFHKGIMELASTKPLGTLANRILLDSIDVLEKPYLYPWSLTDDELNVAMAFLAEKARVSADEAVLKAAVSAVSDYFGPVDAVLKRGLLWREAPFKRNWNC